MRPILYELIKISDYPSLCLFAMHTGYTPASPNPTIQPTDLSRFSLVKYLFLDNCVDSMFQLHVLNACNSVQGLGIQGLNLAERPSRVHSGLWTTAAVAGSPSHVMLFETNCRLIERLQLPAPSILRQCTHLAIEHTAIDVLCISYLLNIVPTVTHLALFYSPPRIHALRRVHEFCAANPGLKMIVLTQIVRRETDRKMIAWSTALTQLLGKLESFDPRLALVKIEADTYEPSSSWEKMVSGEVDIWELGKDRLRQRY